MKHYRLLQENPPNPIPVGRVVPWLGLKLHWLVCQLHTNELMLRQLITKLDGKSDSKTGFLGPIGKMLKDVEKMKPKF